MVLHCCAYGCNSKFGKGRTFHSFPKDPKRLLQWAVAVRRQNEQGGLWLPGKYAKICNAHFAEEAFDRTGQITRLRDTAVPSIFNYSQLEDDSSDVSETSEVPEQPKEKEAPVPAKLPEVQTTEHFNSEETVHKDQHSSSNENLSSEEIVIKEECLLEEEVVEDSECHAPPSQQDFREGILQLSAMAAPDEDLVHHVQEICSSSGRIIKQKKFLSPGSEEFTSPFNIYHGSHSKHTGTNSHASKIVCNKSVQLVDCSVNLGKRLSPSEISTMMRADSKPCRNLTPSAAATGPRRKRHKRLSAPDRKVSAPHQSPSKEAVCSEDTYSHELTNIGQSKRKRKKLLINIEDIDVDDPESVDPMAGKTDSRPAQQQTKGGKNGNVMIMVKASLDQFQAQSLMDLQQAQERVAQHLAKQISELLPKCADSKHPASTDVNKLTRDAAAGESVQAVGAGSGDPASTVCTNKQPNTSLSKEIKKQYRRKLRRQRQQYQELLKKYKTMQDEVFKHRDVGTPEQILNDLQKYLPVEQTILLGSQMYDLSGNNYGKGKFRSILLQFFKESQSGYQYLEKIFKLPSFHTIKKWEYRENLLRVCDN